MWQQPKTLTVYGTQSSKATYQHTHAHCLVQSNDVASVGSGRTKSTSDRQQHHLLSQSLFTTTTLTTNIS